MITGDGGRVGADPLPQRRVFPPSKASSSSSMPVHPSLSERPTVRTSGETLPSLKACKLECAFSRSLTMISCVCGDHCQPHNPVWERECNHTNTSSALNPRAALVNSVQAESNCTSAEGAKLSDGQRVTIDPKMIYR